MDGSEVLPIVVGVHESEASLTAARVAAREAALSGLPLVIYHAFAWPVFYQPAGEIGFGDLRSGADRLVREAVQRVGAEAPDVAVSMEVVDVEPLAGLIMRTQRAALVVVGSDGLGRAVGLPVDSMPVQLAAHAHCPVLVACGTPRTVGPVVVGIDGSAAAEAAVQRAFEAADRRGADLVVVYGEPVVDGADVPVPVDAGVQEADDPLAVAVVPWRDKFPHVPVSWQRVNAEAADALVAQSRVAQLVVVGAQGGRGALLGSVTQAVLHHCGCPVMAVHAG